MALKRSYLKRSNKPIQKLGRRGKRLQAGDAAARKLCKSSGDGLCEMSTFGPDPICAGMIEDHHVLPRSLCSDAARIHPENHMRGCTKHHSRVKRKTKEYRVWIETVRPGIYLKMQQLSNGVVEGVKTL